MKWMMARGAPISGNPHKFNIYICGEDLLGLFRSYIHMSTRVLSIYIYFFFFFIFIFIFYISIATFMEIYSLGY